MDKLKKVLSGQDTEDRGGLAEVSAPRAAVARARRGLGGAGLLAVGRSRTSRISWEAALLFPSYPPPPTVSHPRPGPRAERPRSLCRRSPGAASGLRLRRLFTSVLRPIPPPTPARGGAALGRNSDTRLGEGASGGGATSPAGAGGPSSSAAAPGGSWPPSRPVEVVGVRLTPGPSSSPCCVRCLRRETLDARGRGRIRFLGVHEDSADSRAVRLLFD